MHLHQHHVSAPNIYHHNQTVNVVNAGSSTDELAAYASARHDAIVSQLQAGHTEEKCQNCPFAHNDPKPAAAGSRNPSAEKHKKEKKHRREKKGSRDRGTSCRITPKGLPFPEHGSI